jgi:energy-coupling factor transporter transmembrane protein EcfT
MLSFHAFLIFCLMWLPEAKRSSHKRDLCYRQIWSRYSLCVEFLLVYFLFVDAKYYQKVIELVRKSTGISVLLSFFTNFFFNLLLTVYFGHENKSLLNLVTSIQRKQQQKYVKSFKIAVSICLCGFPSWISLHYEEVVNDLSLFDFCNSAAWNSYAFFQIASILPFQNWFRNKVSYIS